MRGVRGFVGLSFLVLASALAAEPGGEPAESGTPAPDLRAWGSTGGQTTNASFVSLQFGVVTLKTEEGKQLRIPLNRLSEGDRAEAQRLSHATRPSRATPSKKAGAAPAAPPEILDLFGDQLVDASKKSVSVAELANAEKIGIYFSAHWCPPCRRFSRRMGGAM